MGSSAGSILKVAAPVASGLLIATGWGAPLGVALGAAEGSTLAAVGGSALIGAAGGALSGGGLKGTLEGAALGGAGGYVQGAGGLSNALGLSSGAANTAVDASGVAGTLSAGSSLAGAASAGSGYLGAGGGLASSLASSAPSGLSSVLGGVGSNLGSVLSAGANLYSGIQGTAAAKANASAMQDANNKALELQAKNFNQTTQNLAPYLNTGNMANQQLQTDLGLGNNTSDPNFGSLTAPFTAKDLENTPGYQFQLQQGTQALNRQNAASGDYFSGAALKEGQQFAQGLADSTYNTAYQQWLQGKQSNFGMLNSTAQSGQNAAVNQGGFAAGLSGLGTNTLQNTGNITAAGNNAQNTAINNSLAGALTGSFSAGGGSSSYGGGFSGALGGQGTFVGPNGWIYNSTTGQRIA